MMWCSYATTAARSRSSSARRMRRAPSAGCRFIKARSESEKRPGLVRTSIGIFTLPISWSSPATPKDRTSRADSPRDSARAIVRTATFIEWVVVY